MKLFEYLKIAAIASVPLGVFTACNDGNNEPVLNEPHAALVELNYKVEADEDKMNPVAVTIIEGESWTQKTVEVNKESKQTLSLSALPATAGVVIEPSVKADLAPGTEVMVKIVVEGSVTLLNGDKVVDFMPIKEEESLVINVTDGIDLAESYVFDITESKITRLNSSSEDIDDDLTEEFSLPDNDERHVKALGTLYYFSDPGESIHADCLHDNFVSRFSNKQKWDAVPVNMGDYLYLRGSEYTIVPKETIAKSLANGCRIILDELDNKEELKNFCDTYNIYNPLSDDSPGIDHCLFILAKSDNNLSSSADVRIGEAFYMLTPKNDDGEYISDYDQGLVIDNALSSLNELTGTGFNGVKTRSRDYDENRLTSLVNAKKVSMNVNQTLYKSDYHKASAAKDTQTNVYQVEYTIYPCYSITEKRNYYYIHQEFLGSFRPCYKGVYNKAITTNGCHTIAKVCEWYGEEVNLETTPLSSGMTIHSTSPKTTETDVTYTSGLSWNLGGSVGYQGGPSGGVNVSVSGGISVSESESYTKKDVTVLNNCVPKKSLEWTFKMARAYTKWAPFYTAQTSMHEGAAVGRNSFEVGTDFIISFPDTGTAPKLKGNLAVQLRTTSGKCGEECAEKTKRISADKEITLPFFKESDFK